MRTELLAPAGSLAGLKASINAGADAVYIGGSRFGARAYADNPEEADLIRGLHFAHLRGAKVYMTVNTLLKENEMKDLVPYLKPYVEEGLDAVLVQDFGVLRCLHEAFPMLPLHASTQMTVTGQRGASLLASCGVSRVVPARELSLPELIRIKEESGLEVETFVHGALCYCYSGQCLLSSMIGGRSGNRGRCAQPCRLLNLLNDRDHFDGRTSILDRKDARHFLSPKDLCAIRLIPDLIDAGIDSLKIEGRMKRPEYAAGVVSIYRACLDRAYAAKEEGGAPYHVTREEKQALYDLYNRNGFTDGYFYRKNGPEMMAPIKHVLTGEETEARHSLYEKMNERYMARDLTLPVTAHIEVKSGEPIRAELSAKRAKGDVPDEVTAVFTGPAADAAKKSPLSEERIRESFLKTGGTDFEIRDLTVSTDGRSFVPVSQLNDFRRQALMALKEAILAPHRRDLSPEEERCFGQAPASIPAAKKIGQPATIPAAKKIGQSASGSSAEKRGIHENLRIRVLAATKDQLRASFASPAVELVYVEAALLYHYPDPVKEALSFIERAVRAGKKPGIAMPRVDRERCGTSGKWSMCGTARELKDAAEELVRAGLQVFLVRTLETASELLDAGFGSFLRADAGLYTFNSGAQQFLKEKGILLDTSPVELNRKELRLRDNTGSEIIAYGRLPLMVSAQCLKKNTSACTGKNEMLTLTDRTGAKFTVRCECAFCYNIHYNSVPLSLISEADELRAMGFPAIRLEFTTEDGAECRRILAYAEKAAKGETTGSGAADSMSAGQGADYTRGHYLRGVE